MVALKYKLPSILAAVTIVNASNLKGVAPEKFELYKPSSDGTWTCLDGSKTILYSAVNDDYCDCIDGSDEPGTSACPNTFFYCANEGHIPAYIKSFAVNDGVCDEACCDGSDENGDLISCPNRCKEVGEAYRKEQSHLKRSTKAGLSAKNKLIEDAEKQVALWEEQQSKLEDEIILKKSNMLRLQRELNDLESRSTGAKHKKKCQSGALEVATLKHDIVILQKELDTLKNILGDMKRDHNHNFHDMAVKSAISGYDEFLTRYDDIKADIEENLQNINIQESEDDNSENTEDETSEEAPVEEVDEGKQQQRQSIVDLVLDKLDTILPTVLKNNVLEKIVPVKKNNEAVLSKSLNHDDGISKEAAVETARKLYQEAEREVSSLNGELEKIKEDLSTDYGTEREWLKLKDVCVEKNEGEYTYSLCFLGDAYQKSNKDSTRTFLGKFNSFDGNDDALYSEHTHNHGTRCWNGPERSVKAKIECGLNNEILEVTEPEKCEYHFRMKSPAVCKSVSNIPAESNTKEEKKDHTEHTHEEL